MKAQKTHFKHAKTCHLRGNFDEAERLYIRHLNTYPGDAECLNLLGLLHADTNRYDTSLQLLRAAIGIEGPKPWLCRNLGIVLERMGDLSAAAACYRQALAADPSDHQLWGALANLQRGAGEFLECAKSFTNAFLSTTCDAASGRAYRLAAADALLRAGDRPGAIALYDEVLQQEPDHKIATFHRAVAHMQAGHIPEARAGFARTLELAPQYGEAANNLGILAQAEKKYPEAVVWYLLAIRCNPDDSAALYNLGTARQESGQLREAGCVFRKLLKRQPDHGSAWVNFGNTLLAQNEVQEAIGAYRAACRISPGEATAEWNLGIANLLTGDLAAGWQGYEKRFFVPGSAPRRPRKAPAWQGEPLAGKTLLLHAEQGLGDTLQFVRYADCFASQGATIYLEAQPALFPLLGEAPGVARLFAAGEEAPSTDFQLPLLSAPALAQTTLPTIPSPGGYLRAPADSVAKWRRWLGHRSRSRKRAGICWAGNPNHKNDRNRSIAPQLLEMLEEAGDVEWINLQKGLTLPPLGMRNAARELRDFGDTAGLIANLDLVVSVDTSVAHLAGALGKPVWVLLPYAPDWRWMLDREDSPWYSQARLFRQDQLGAWRPVLQRVVQALSALP